MKNIHLFIIAFIFTNLIFSEQPDCKTNMKQYMKPTHPDTNYQGFGTVIFNINTKGFPKKIKSISSECAVGRDKNEKIILEKCPFFKSNAVNAAKYMRFTPPKDSQGNSCEIKDMTFTYKFSLYNIKLDDNDFLIREDIKNISNKEDGLDARIFSPSVLNNNQSPPELTSKAAAIQNAKP